MSNHSTAAQSRLNAVGEDLRDVIRKEMRAGQHGGLGGGLRGGLGGGFHGGLRGGLRGGQYGGVRDKLREGIYDEQGAVTAEYAVVIMGAVAFAGVLVAIMRSGEVRAFLLNLIEQALGSAG